jgi:hypothetical protein
LFIFAFISQITVRMAIYWLGNHFSWTSEDKNTISTNIFYVCPRKILHESWKWS